jgi:hypothetical protein
MLPSASYGDSASSSASVNNTISGPAVNLAKKMTPAQMAVYAVLAIVAVIVVVAVARKV